MKPTKIIACPAYVIAQPQNAHAFDTIETQGEKWFSVYHDREIAEERIRQIGGTIRAVTDEAHFQSILTDHPHIDGFLVNNSAQPELFSPVTRTQLLGD
jgi:hypothetical protein